MLLLLKISMAIGGLCLLAVLFAYALAYVFEGWLGWAPDMTDEYEQSVKNTFGTGQPKDPLDR